MTVAKKATSYPWRLNTITQI